VHVAGGVMAILNELKQAKKLNTECNTVLGIKIGDLVEQKQDDKMWLAAPGGVKTSIGFSQEKYFTAMDLDRQNGCIRSVENAYSQDGGLAVLFGNLAEQGCVVKTAGVDESILQFIGKAIVFESQDDAMKAILNNQVKAGHVVVIRYEGPRGGPGMQEMLYPTSYLKSMGLGKQCALITDGRFSGGTAGLSIGHISPEASEGGLIALVENDDTIEINIPKRTIDLLVLPQVLQQRREAKNGIFKPQNRDRKISKALQLYSMTVGNASVGACRILPDL
jgi:dihydroxy-acid dehydratase